MSKDFGSGGPPLVWEMETGSGYASPAIADGRLIFLHRVGDREVVDCVRAETGEHLWRYGYLSAYRDRYGFSNGPRSSPVIDCDRVYTHGAEGMLHCLSIEWGKVLWSTNTSRRFNVSQDFFGVGSTPLVDGDALIVQVGAVDGPAVVAFDKMTGDIRWQSGEDWAAGYASPIPVTIGGPHTVTGARRWVFAFMGGDTRPPVGGLMVIEPKSGVVASAFHFRSKTYESVNASSPVLVSAQVLDVEVFISSSYKTGGVCLRVDQRGVASEKWRTDDLGAHFATPVVLDGQLYGITGSSQRDCAVVCLDCNTGRTLWKHTPEWGETRTLKDGKKQDMTYTVGLGSLLAANGELLLLGEMGHLAWLKPSDSAYREMARTRLFHANETWTMPVISHGLLYICQNRPDLYAETSPRLLCYDLRAGQP